MKSKKTNPLPPGTENLVINMPVGMKREIEERAAKNEMSVSDYTRIILMDAVRRKVNVDRQVTLVPSISDKE